MKTDLLAQREYTTTSHIDGPLIIVEGIHNVGFNEIVEITDSTGRQRLGTVMEAAENRAVVQVFEGTMGLALKKTHVRFKGKPLTLGVTKNMLGRVFDGIGRPIDNLPDPIAEKKMDVNGIPMNPTARAYPEKFIQTGISSIDGMNTLIRGQKLPFFSGSGLPHNRLAAQITRQACIPGEESSFAVVFAAMGIKYDVAQYFIKNFQESGILKNVALFLNLADDPPIERLVTPRAALTIAEHLAFDHNMHVLVIMTDMSNYCESLREISTLRGDVPSRKGYPGFLYSDLASLFERAGIIRGAEGSITQIPILTMPNDDITHPIPDLTGYITEGQIVFGWELERRGLYPPVSCLPSLSRLMKDGIGEGMTREDHPAVASQLFAMYARVKDVRALASVIGEEELTPLDHRYLECGEMFEKQFIAQREDENRTIEKTLEIAWEVLSVLPKDELYRISDQLLKKYYLG
ncbi:V-type ATP synthase subunit B [bacterium]|nr:V-type ATP synthase subunit B [bacterium]